VKEKEKREQKLDEAPKVAAPTTDYYVVTVPFFPSSYPISLSPTLTPSVN